MSTKYIKRDKIKDLIQYERLYQIQLNKEVESLLKIKAFTVGHQKATPSHSKSNLNSRQSKRTTNHSLGIKLQKIKLKPIQKETQTSEVQSQPVQRHFTKRIQSKLQIIKKEQVKKQRKQSLSQEKEFVEKKMNIGNKSKKNQMKNFILEMLKKGNAQGNCLVIQKGTAHCGNSPKQYNNTEIKVIQKQQERQPLVLVQNSHNIRLKPIKKIKLNQIKSENKTVLHLPSINQNTKYVQMARKYQYNKIQLHKNQEQAEQQKKEKMDQNLQQIPEMIQQNASIVCKIETQQEIKQQIQINQSIKCPKE